MAHTFSRVHVHVVFSTKDRRTTIPKEWQPRLWAYIAGTCKNQEISALAVGGTENHIHILFRLPPKLALAKTISLKANSSKWMGKQGIRFSWQEGYGAFSVSSSNLDQVIRYIQNQEARHRKTSFEDEFRMLLRKHGVEYDPKFVLGQACAAPTGLRAARERVPTAHALGYVLSPLPGLVPQFAQLWNDLPD